MNKEKKKYSWKSIVIVLVEVAVIRVMGKLLGPLPSLIGVIGAVLLYMRLHKKYSDAKWVLPLCFAICVILAIVVDIIIVLILMNLGVFTE